MNTRKPFIVIQRSIDEAVNELPVVRLFDRPVAPIDLFVGAAGFEERVLAIPKQLLAQGAQISGASLIGRYKTNVEDNGKRETELIPILQRLAAPVEFFDADSPESTNCAIRSVLGALSNGKKRLHVAFDISGASSTLIFSVLGSLLRDQRPFSLTIFYSTAKTYYEPSSGRETPVLKWAPEDMRESGVAEVEANELYPGIHHDHLPVFVIALPSMFTSRMQRCLSYLGVGPLGGGDRCVHWILPNTTEQEHRWRQDKVLQAAMALVRSGTEESDQTSLAEESFSYCDVFNYVECVRKVMKQIDAKAGSNISVVHMGTKLQGVGVALALAARSEVAIVSARPEWFDAASYSQGVGEVFCLEFTHPHEIVKGIAQVGTLTVQSTAT